MSVEFRKPARMPQPEQWLSEHPWWAVLIFLVFYAGILVLAGVLP